MFELSSRWLRLRFLRLCQPLPKGRKTGLEISPVTFTGPSPLTPMPKPGFYAVRIGRQPGVYHNWNNCEAQIKGFPNARHKKFVSLRDAQEFVNGADASNTPHSNEESPKSASGSKNGGRKRLFAEIEDESGWEVVYSDGACKGNGKVGSVAGLGIWWGEDDARNIAERCPGEQTNNRAELIAIFRVLENTPLSKKPLLIKTDSQYSINCFQTWVHNWREKDWKTVAGNAVKNEGIIRCISKCLEIRAKSGQKVLLQYVRGHSGEVGNEGADRLANQGAFMPPTRELDWKLLEDHLEEVFSKIDLEGPDEAAKPSVLGISSEPTQGSTDSAPSSRPMGVDQAANLISQETLPEASVRVICANPPLVPERAEDLNFEDYADCILNDDDLAKELLERI